MMKLTFTNQDGTRRYEGETKYDCLVTMAEVLQGSLFVNCLEANFEFVREEVSPMVSDEEITVRVFETLAKMLDYKVEWEGEEE